MDWEAIALSIRLATATTIILLALAALSFPLLVLPWKLARTRHAAADGRPAA